MKKPVVLVLGKIPPPYMGPSIATAMLLQSSLKDHYRLIHLDTRAHRSLDSMGRWSSGKSLRTLWIYSRLKFLILRHWPDLVLIPVSQSTLGFVKDSLYLLITKVFFRKAVFHLRGSNFRNWYNSASGWTRWYVRFILSMVNGVIVQGERLKTVFEGLVPGNKIHVVPNGADYPVVPEFQRHRPFTILYLANLQASKGIEDLLESIRLLSGEKTPPFIVKVVGAWRSDEVKRTCMDFVQSNRLPVEFFPSASGDDKFNYLMSADTFVFTPREPEGHPWVIVEAQAAGLPVIATPQGAIPEAVIDGVNGFIVGVRRPDEIADRLKRVMEDQQLQLSLGRKSRATYEDRYTEKKMVERMVEAIDNVIKAA